jgi:GntR family transcriptional repressor for pyruvate dehydrogenase complex
MKELTEPPRRLAQRRVLKVAESVAREIMHDIRGFTPGTRLPAESEMVVRYGVGRSSVREALRILEVQGLIVIRQGIGGGPVVAQVESRNYANMTTLYCQALGATYRDVMEARLVMEPMMARLAAKRQDETTMRKLAQIAASPPGEDVQAYLDTERDFHTLLSGMSGNPVLDLMSRALKIIYTDKVYPSVTEEQRARIARDHVAIADAIERGDADDAECLMREHMNEFVHESSMTNPGVLDEIVDWH